LNTFTRRAALGGALSFAAVAHAEDRPLRIVLGFPPGASSDTLTRLIAEKMRGSLGRPVVVENKPGAAGIVANMAVKAAPPDGTTLLMTPLATMVAFPHSYAKLDYDPFKDYTPVAHIASFQLAFGVGPNVPAKSLAEYVALVKTGGTYAKGRILATSGAKRSPQYPDVPTFRESGYDIEGSAWYGLFAPAGTPKDVVEGLGRAANDAVRQPDVRQRIEPLGLEATGLGPAELAAIMKSDDDKWGRVIRASGFKAE
jgi:tripartite-type tricarboxylate transporter receptor subunit TctC